MPDLTRRNALQMLATAPASAFLISAASSAAQDRPVQPSTNILVAYFTRTGNTGVIAHQIQRATSADIFEILPAVPYPEIYQETVDQARRETEAGFEPDLQAHLEAIAAYDTVYLGLPIWGMTAPPIIRSFLSAHDLAGKTVVPFITHGGYGTGGSLSVLAEHAPGARFAEAFVMEADQERRTLEQVTFWLGNATP